MRSEKVRSVPARTAVTPSPAARLEVDRMVTSVVSPVTAVMATKPPDVPPRETWLGQVETM